MKRKGILVLLVIMLVLVGCSSSNNKILGNIELNKTTRDDLNNLNFEIESTKVWDDARGIFVYTYIWDYADYTLNNVDGTIRIRFTNNLAQGVNYSAEATKENMEQLVNYLVDTYGKDYEEVEDYTTRWRVNDLTIDYVLTDEGTIEIRWYEE